MPVFFDFREINDLEQLFRLGDPILWYLDPKSRDARAYLTVAKRADFIEALRKGTYRMGLYQAEAVPSDY